MMAVSELQAVNLTLQILYSGTKLTNKYYKLRQ